MCLACFVGPTNFTPKKTNKRNRTYFKTPQISKADYGLAQADLESAPQKYSGTTYPDALEQNLPPLVFATMSTFRSRERPAVAFLPEPYGKARKHESVFTTEPIVDKCIGRIVWITPHVLIASSGHPQQRSRNSRAAGPSFQAADVDIGDIIGEAFDETNDFSRVGSVEGSRVLCIFRIRKIKYEDVFGSARIDMVVVRFRADDDRILFLRKIERIVVYRSDAKDM